MSNNRPRFRAYPNGGTITIADGDTYPIRVTGNFINVKSADQDFTIRIDGSEELKAAQNRRFRLSPDDSFKSIEVINDSGSSLTFQLEIGYGGVESDDVTITGTVSTSDSTSHTKLDTIETTLTSIETDAAAIEALLTNDEDKRTGLSTLEGASFAQVSNATTTIVTAGANTSGIIIRSAHLVSTGGAGSTCALTVNANDLINLATTVAGNLEETIKDIFIPAGWALAATTNGAGNKVSVFYEVL